jgi:hypothetical protein
MGVSELCQKLRVEFGLVLSDCELAVRWGSGRMDLMSVTLLV